MGRATIIEQSETANLKTVVTVRSSRGDEYLFDVDALACGFGQLLSNLENERRGGWGLQRGWFEEEIRSLRAACHVEIREITEEESP